jgi:hypothetical protein
LDSGCRHRIACRARPMPAITNLLHYDISYLLLDMTDVICHTDAALSVAQFIVTSKS